MKRVIVPNNVHPRQIDDFGPDVERSKPGALYFAPGSVKIITDSEMKWLESHYKKFADRLTVLDADEKSIIREKRATEQPKVEKITPKNKPSQAKLRAAELLKKKFDSESIPAEIEIAPAPSSVEGIESQEIVEDVESQENVGGVVISDEQTISSYLADLPEEEMESKSSGKKKKKK
jgi:hypothetical protein